MALLTAEASPRRGLVLVIKGEDADAACLVAVRSHLQERLPGWMVPAKIVKSDDLPVQISGKIDHQIARKRFGIV